MIPRKISTRQVAPSHKHLRLVKNIRRRLGQPFAEQYNPNHEPAGSPDGGEFAPGPGGSGSRETASRADRALTTYKPSTAAKQRFAERQEKKVAIAAGGNGTSDNAPVDVVVNLSSGKKLGIEVKTFVDQTNSKVTMHPESLKRKVSWARREHARLATVVIDARKSVPRYYVRKGVGSFRLKTMTPIKLKDLRRFLA